MPMVCANIKKQRVKKIIEDLLESLFKALHCRNNLTQDSAVAFIAFLSKFLGPRVFASRLDV